MHASSACAGQTSQVSLILSRCSVIVSLLGGLWDRDGAAGRRRRDGLGFDSPALDRIPLQVLALAERLNGHLADDYAIHAQHAVAVQGLIGANSGLQITMMQRQVFRALPY